MLTIRDIITLHDRDFDAEITFDYTGSRGDYEIDIFAIALFARGGRDRIDGIEAGAPLEVPTWLHNLLIVDDHVLDACCAAAESDGPDPDYLRDLAMEDR